MFNFIQFAADHHIPIAREGEHHHAHRGWVQTHCPFCAGGRGGFHLGFKLSEGYFNCWRCGYHRISDAIRVWCRLPDEKAKEVRWKYDDGRHSNSGNDAPTSARRPKVPKPLGLDAVSHKHLKYLREERGFKHPQEIVEEWDLKGTTNSTRGWSWRLVAPVHNEIGDIVAYVGRSIFDVKPKWRMTENDHCAEPPEDLVYGIHKAKGDAVIIVEGPGDVWKMGPGTVATLSIDWREHQAHKLRQYKKRFIMFDPDEQAQKRAMQLAEWLSYFPGETEVIYGLDKEPGDMQEKEARKLHAELLGE